jgi:hypothetical protein
MGQSGKGGEVDEKLRLERSGLCRSTIVISSYMLGTLLKYNVLIESLTIILVYQQVILNKYLRDYKLIFLAI